MYKWPDGRYYRGHYLKGKKDGYGEYKWKDGKICNYIDIRQRDVEKRKIAWKRKIIIP